MKSHYLMPYVDLKLIDLQDNNKFRSDQAISRDFFLTSFLFFLTTFFLSFSLKTRQFCYFITQKCSYFDQQRRNVLVVLRPGYTHTLEGLASSQNSLQRPIGLRSRPLFESEGRGGSSVFKAGLALAGLS